MKGKCPLVSIVIPTYNRKNKLERLLKSVEKSTYPLNKIEIIVVDDFSSDGTSKHIKNNFPFVKIIRNNYEKLVSASRNIGIKNSNGKYIFLIDDDNVISKNCIKLLVFFLEKNKEIGIVAPIMYYYNYPKRIWCAGIKRNFITSLTKYVGNNEVDKKRFKSPIESEDFPNAFMVRKEIFRKVGYFDEVNFPFHYEESDFCCRVRIYGYK